MKDMWLFRALIVSFSDQVALSKNSPKKSKKGGSLRELEVSAMETIEIAVLDTHRNVSTEEEELGKKDLVKKSINKKLDKVTACQKI